MAAAVESEAGDLQPEGIPAPEEARSPADPKSENPGFHLPVGVMVVWEARSPADSI